ncbi:tetratricopeptide repeat protein [Marinobacter sp. NSM]|uniref:tetratricopeptide repeat protein n=1 Tax=Marinobacter sp. NSM TaxID=3458004 RepID=UPI004037055E
MSLLNDALRAAEERQNHTRLAGAYTGQPMAQDTGRSRAPVVLLLILVLALISGAGAWWLLSSDSEEQVVVAEIASVEPMPEIQEITETPAQPQVIVEPLPAEPATRTEPSTPDDAPTAEAAMVTETAPEQLKPADMEPAAAQNEPDVIQLAQTQPQPAAPEANTESRAPETSVKQQRETPEAVDLRTSRELERLLASGRNGEAERVLAALTTRQSAPQSREVFAREMLVLDRPGRALEWLPDSVTNEYAGLRLLKARAQLAQGDLNLALATLQARVPPVAEQVEYRITLATLLQQAGEADESAGHWSELIAHDDSQGAWWLGLAIALETGGRNRSALQAYAQAAVMPGLSASLADYARQRISVLQAES